MDLDYDTDIVTSKENVETFVLYFCQAISKVLSCDINNVRVFTIEKLNKKSSKTRVNFGLTTTEHEQTKQLAEQLKVDNYINYLYQVWEMHTTYFFCRYVLNQAFQMKKFWNMSNHEIIYIHGKQF